VDLRLPSGQQRLRVEVARPGPDAEVHLVTGAPDGVAPPDLVAPAHVDGDQVRVRGPQPVGVQDHDVVRRADPPGEHDLAVGGRPHGVSRLGPEVEPPVARPVRGGRRAEVIDDRALDRRAVGALGNGAGHPGRADGGHQHDTEHSAHGASSGSHGHTGEALGRP
jgi:hypothetical protein